MIWLVLFRLSADATGFIPDVIETPFATATECWSVGFSMKQRDPHSIIWFSCERLGQWQGER